MKGSLGNINNPCWREREKERYIVGEKIFLLQWFPSLNKMGRIPKGRLAGTLHCTRQANNNEGEEVRSPYQLMSFVGFFLSINKIYPNVQSL